MALVTKTFAFASDSETLADLALLTTITFAFEGADGNPSGSVKFTSTQKSLSAAVEKGRGSGTTWETFGVPAGATVNTVRVVSYSRKVVAVTKLSSHSHILRFVNGAGATIGGDLASEALPTATGGWLAGGGIAAAQTVGQASNATALFEIAYTLTTLGGGGSASIDARMDQVVVEIDYTASNPVTVTPSTLSVATATFAPTVTATNNQVVTPGVVALTTTTFAPTVSATNHQTVTPGTASLTLTAFAPTVTASSGVVVTPGTVSLATTLFAPTVSVSDHKRAEPPTLALTATGLAPTVSVTAHITVTLGTAALTLSTFAPTVTGSGGSSTFRWGYDYQNSSHTPRFIFPE